MHESAMMKNLVRQIDDVATREGAKSVVSISVWLGALSHFTPEHFVEHFREDAKGSLAEGAEVKFEVSNDTQDPKAQDAVLVAVEVSED
ncbi:MAG: hydrogenase maturation nickel metallochaperone HypA [Bdellovibrionales bacterium]|nr:hydrogenase maturation nickel metallochaperone HypA [Bdellovibrionales bacterium]